MEDDDATKDRSVTDESQLNTAETAGVAVGAIIGVIAVVIAILQLLASLKWIPERWQPFRQISRLFFGARQR